MNRQEIPELPDDILEVLACAKSVGGPSSDTQDAIFARVKQSAAAPMLEVASAAEIATPKSPIKPVIFLSAAVLVAAATAVLSTQHPYDNNISQETTKTVAEYQAQPSAEIPIGADAEDFETQDEADSRKTLVLPVTPRQLATGVERNARRQLATDAPTTTPLPSEQSLLRRARRQFLAQNYLTALSTLRRHRLLYRNGVLAEERDALSIRALAKRGSTERARKLGQTFLQRYPGSIHIPVIQNAIR